MTTLEDFVVSAGNLMGAALDGFGGGGPGGVGGPGLGGVDGLLDGQGAGVGGHNQENQQIGRDVMAAVQNDARGDAGLAAALTGAGTGRARMTGVIHQAIADVEALGLSTHTPQGKRALIEAVERRLRETQNTVADGRADAATHAASADTTAAGYGGISPAGAGGLPGMGAMPGMGGGMPGGLGSLSPASALSGLTGMASGLSSLGKSDTEGWRDASDRGRGFGKAQVERIAEKEVQFERKAFPGGKKAYIGYINQMLDAQGVTDPAARQRWMTGYLTATDRESSYNPLAINLSDSNAHGRPAPDSMPWNSSRGGAQTIPATFAAYHQAGTSRNIYDPVANLCASRNYVMARYGVAADGSNLSKVAQFNPNVAGHGY